MASKRNQPSGFLHHMTPFHSSISSPHLLFTIPYFINIRRSTLIVITLTRSVKSIISLFSFFLIVSFRIAVDGLNRYASGSTNNLSSKMSPWSRIPVRGGNKETSSSVSAIEF